MIPGEFRVNHRAASESLLHAAAENADADLIKHELDKARYFETEAVKYIVTHRQRALATGLLHAIDLMRAVADAEFKTPPPQPH
jgi:hypothetical protein